MNMNNIPYINSKIEGLNLQTNFQNLIVYVLITVINLWLFKYWIIYALLWKCFLGHVWINSLMTSTNDTAMSEYFWWITSSVTKHIIDSKPYMVLMG